MPLLRPHPLDLSREHAAQRSLRRDTLILSADSLEIIESYPNDKYLPSFLLRGEYEESVFHALMAADVDGGNVRVVTIYVPSAAEWDSGLRVRMIRQ